MVKQPQSKLGYMIDGKLWIPPRHKVSAGDKNGVSRREWKEQHRATKKKPRNRLKQSSDSSSNSIRAICKKLRFTSTEIEDLKNASKQGQDNVAYFLTREIPVKHFGIRTYYTDQYKIPTFVVANDNCFVSIARCLVIPDIENRSAVYYAAHSGCDRLVKTYLALLVLARTIRQPDRAARLSWDSERKSIRKWFEHLGFVDFFGPKEFDVCVLNALNDKVKALFKHQEYTLVELRDTIMRSLWAPHVPKTLEKHLLPTRKTVRPRLIVEDDSACCYDDINIDSDDKDFHQDAESVDDADTKNDDYDDEIVMQLYQLMVNCETRDSEERGLEISNDDDGELVHLDTCDASSYGEWSDVHSLVASDSFVHILDQQGKLTAEQEDDECSWSVVSDVASVKSMASTGPLLSYSDALRLGEAKQLAADNKPVTTMPSVSEDKVLDTKRTATGEEECVDSAFDDFFMREGQKGSRGGKGRLMFRGNQRTSR